MTDWFTSDTHFGHTNVIKYSGRPYKTANHMDESMIANWNAKVGQMDRVFHLGDFCMTDRDRGQHIFDRLNGQKHLVLGNHDKAGRQIKGWNWVHPYHELRIEKQSIVLCHYAMRVWNKSHHGAWMLYGHSHGSLPDDPNAKSIDVGVDCHDYAPISFADISRIMAKKTTVAVDHHGS